MQANTRAQLTQRVLYEIAYLSSSVPERAEFLRCMHERLGQLIDAENFYLALYDRKTGKITYPYYVDVIDTDVVDPNNYDILNPAHLSMTGQVLTSEQPLFITAADIEQAQQAGRYYCIGDRPEFWMGAPLKSASDKVFGILAMQVYDTSRIYSAEDRALFLVVVRHVAMALDRILHRADLEEQVARRTSELSKLNAALRHGIAERERSEHLQATLYQIAELSSRPGDTMEFFRSLHGIVGELLYARNFYIALFKTKSGEVSFPYYVDDRLDLYMLERVVAIHANERYAHWPPVHVNCSSYSMTRPEFADDVLALLRRYRVEPSRVCLELTEGALVAEPDLARRTMQHLTDNGMSVVLDDFGAGFSSLSYVHQYQFGGLKIDKSFILELAESLRSRAIVRAIVRMAESLGLTLVAKGVEDAATLSMLCEMGAAQAQGYFFDKPMPLDALTRTALAPRGAPSTIL